MSPRQFPTGGKYVDALQNTSLCFKDSELRRASPTLTKLNRPKPISGNFASVFQLTSASGRRYAVKCFTREVADQERRYQAISDHLATVHRPWKVGFEYLSQGVWVEREWYPALKMEWVSGIGLSRWIENHLHDARAIELVAGRFAELTGQLAEAGIAHGDLQHGNLLVAPDDSLRLVDYDGMYVPALAGFPAAEKGHRNYQSPHRTDADFGPELDRFSAWVIYLSLVALAADPGLWQQLHDPGGEYLLLDSSDFENPTASPRLPMLLQHSTSGVRELAERVRDQLGMSLSALPELLSLTTAVGSAPTWQSSPELPPLPSRAATALPDWMAGHLPAEPPRPPVIFAGRRPFFRVALFVLIVVAAALLTTLGLLAPTAAGASAVCGIAGLALVYRRRPETVQKRQARRHHRAIIQQFDDPQASLARLERKRAELEKDATARTTSFTARQQDLQERRQKQLTRIDLNTQQRLSKIDAQLTAISLRKSQEIAKELQRIQDQYVRARIAHAVIEPGQISGIGAVAVENLRRVGIRTAADFTGIHLALGSARYGSSIAYFQLTRGGRVRVEGIGEVKATSLDEWRKNHEHQARRTQPTTLPTDRRQAITNRLAAEQRALTAKKAKVRADADAERNVVVARSAVDQTTLLDGQRRANIEVATQRAESDRHIKELRAGISIGRVKIQEAENELTRYKRVTFSRFVGFALIGRPV